MNCPFSRSDLAGNGFSSTRKVLSVIASVGRSFRIQTRVVFGTDILVVNDGEEDSRPYLSFI